MRTMMNKMSYEESQHLASVWLKEMTFDTPYDFANWPRVKQDSFYCRGKYRNERFELFHFCWLNGAPPEIAADIVLFWNHRGACPRKSKAIYHIQTLVKNVKNCHGPEYEKLCNKRGWNITTKRSEGINPESIEKEFNHRSVTFFMSQKARKRVANREDDEKRAKEFEEADTQQLDAIVEEYNYNITHPFGEDRIEKEDW